MKSTFFAVSVDRSDTTTLMQADYSKITLTLVLAFGMIVDGDYLFRVIINDTEPRALTQEDIFKLSLDPEVHIIDMDRRLDTRRWHDRHTNRERRKSE